MVLEQTNIPFWWCYSGESPGVREWTKVLCSSKDQLLSLGTHNGPAQCEVKIFWRLPWKSKVSNCLRACYKIPREHRHSRTRPEPRSDGSWMRVLTCCCCLEEHRFLVHIYIQKKQSFSLLPFPSSSWCVFYSIIFNKHLLSTQASH